MNDNEIAALRLIASGGKGMTERANMLVSAAAANLLRLGLIEYASACWVGYKLTKAGRLVIA